MENRNMQATQEDKIERRLSELRDIAGQYAEAKAKAKYLDHFRKSKLALLQKYYLSEGYKNVNAQEREARADPEYIQILDALYEATREAERLYWELQIASLGAGLWQTQQANMRAERRAYGA